MPSVNNSNNYDGNILLPNSGTDATSEHFGFGRNATTNQSTGPRIISVTTDPNGVLTAPVGSVALSAQSGGGLYFNTNGTTGWSRVSGSVLQQQGAPTAKTVSSTLTAAEMLAGIITVNQGGGATSTQTLPLATAMDTALPTSVANDSFDFSLINISTAGAEDADIATAAGWTLVGSMAVQSNDAITSKSSGRFRARKTAAGAWTLYRLA